MEPANYSSFPGNTTSSSVEGSISLSSVDEKVSAAGKRSYSKEEPPTKAFRSLSLNDAADVSLVTRPAPFGGLVLISEEEERNAIKGSLQEFFTVPTAIDPFWELLDRCNPKRKIEVIVWLFLQASGVRDLDPSQVEVEVLQKLNIFGSANNLFMLEILINEFCSRETKLLESSGWEIVSFLEKVIQNPFRLPCYSFISYLYERVGYCVMPLVRKMFITHLHQQGFRDFLSKANLEKQGIVGNCILDARTKMTPEVFRDWLFSIELSPSVLEQLYIRLREITPAEADLFLRLLENTYPRDFFWYQQMRDNAIAILYPVNPQRVRLWVCEHVPTSDPLFQRHLKECSPQEVISLIKTSELRTPEFFAQLVNLGGEHLCTEPDWEELVDNILTRVMPAWHMSLERFTSFERETLIAWVRRARVEYHLRLFNHLVNSVDFPEFWPHFRIAENVNPKELFEFLFKVAVQWPELRLTPALQRPHPRTYMSTEHLIHRALFHHHFPQVAPCPELPRSLGRSIFKKLVIMNCALSSPANRAQFKRQVPELIEQIDRISRLERNEKFGASILLLKVVKNVVAESKNISPELVEKIRFFIFITENIVQGRTPPVLTIIKKELNTLLDQYTSTESPVEENFSELTITENPSVLSRPAELETTKPEDADF